FAWRGGLWCVSCVRELTDDGWCEMVLARLDETDDGQRRMTDWRTLQPEGPRLHQKNWMAFVDSDDLRFVYLCDPTRIVDDQAATLAETPSRISAAGFRGGSALIDFAGGRLAIVHEMVEREGRRHYRHRFVWFDAELRLRGLSRPFYFRERGIEFAA